METVEGVEVREEGMFPVDWCNCLFILCCSWTTYSEMRH